MIISSHTNAVVPDDFTVSISTSSTSILAGQMFNLTCTVRTVDGLQNVPTVEWLDETSTRVTTGGDITVGSAMTSGTMTTLALVFSPLRVSHGGEFTCRANLTSPAPPQQLTKSAEWDLIVGSKYTYRPVAFNSVQEIPWYSFISNMMFVLFQSSSKSYHLPEQEQARIISQAVHKQNTLIFVD